MFYNSVKGHTTAHATSANAGGVKKGEEVDATIIGGGGKTPPGPYLVMFTVPWCALQPLGYVVGHNTQGWGIVEVRKHARPIPVDMAAALRFKS